GLVDVALCRRAVAEVRDDRFAVRTADLAVLHDAHRVSGRVQRLGADDDRVHVELELVGVPATEVDASEQAERHDRVDAAAVEHAVLTVGREHHIDGATRTAGADLGRLQAPPTGQDRATALGFRGGYL